MDKYKFSYMGKDRILHQMKDTVGFDMYTLGSDDSVTYHLIKNNGMYEKHLTDLMYSKLLFPGMTSIDVGANAGYYSIMLGRAAAKGFDPGKLYIFEPNPEQERIIKSNMTINDLDNVYEFFPYLVGDYNDDARSFQLRDHVKGGNSLFRTMNFRDGSRTIGVKQIILDEVIPKDAKIDLLRIDAEGADFAVIRGAEKIIDRNPEIRVCFEYCQTHLIAAGEVPEDCLTWLHKKGFEFVVCNENHTMAISYEDMLKYMVKPTDLTNIIAYRD